MRAPALGRITTVVLLACCAAGCSSPSAALQKEKWRCELPCRGDCLVIHCPHLGGVCRCRPPVACGECGRPVDVIATGELGVFAICPTCGQKRLPRDPRSSP